MTDQWMFLLRCSKDLHHHEVKRFLQALRAYAKFSESCRRTSAPSLGDGMHPYLA
jgi:hypothetical protein